MAGSEPALLSSCRNSITGEWDKKYRSLKARKKKDSTNNFNACNDISIRKIIFKHVMSKLGPLVCIWTVQKKRLPSKMPAGI